MSQSTRTLSWIKVFSLSWFRTVCVILALFDVYLAFGGNGTDGHFRKSLFSVFYFIKNYS